MLRHLGSLLFLFGLLFGIGAGSLMAGGPSPAVNIDMGCTTVGQPLIYNGSIIVCGGSPTLPSTVIGSLPACGAGTLGRMYLVTDALIPAALATVGAGGGVTVVVVCNATNWIVL